MDFLFIYFDFMVTLSTQILVATAEPVVLLSGSGMDRCDGDSLRLSFSLHFLFSNSMISRPNKMG